MRGRRGMLKTRFEGRHKAVALKPGLIDSLGL